MAIPVVLNADNLILELESKVAIVKNISFSLYKQDSIVFLGTSGSGKTTLLKILAGLTEPTKGSVNVLGSDIHAMPKLKRMGYVIQHIGYVFQDGALISTMNVFDNVALPLRYHGIFKEKEIREQVEEILARFDLLEERHQYPDQLSLGQKKFVAFARTLLINPTILFMDEPTASVDIRSANKMINLVRWFNIMGGTVVSITHDMFYANAIASKMGIIHNGELLALDTPTQIKASPNQFITEILRSVSSDADLADELLKLMSKQNR